MDSIDIVINNAGILDERRWEREISVNIGGMITVANLAMQFMGKDQEKNGGVLVNVGQYFDFKRTAQLPVYSATKYAIIALSQTLGVSLIFLENLILNLIFFFIEKDINFYRHLITTREQVSG